MTNQKRRKGGGGKLTRSQTVAVRMDPKLRYLAELAARKQRRTLSSYIEWTIEDSLKDIMLSDQTTGAERTLAEMSEVLWDVDEPDRLVRLALKCPDLLTFDEQHQWKVISETTHFWEDASRGSDKKARYDLIRDDWDIIKKYAAGEITKEEYEAAILPF